MQTCCERKMMIEYITDDIEISSNDSDIEDSFKKNFNEECSDEENCNEDNQV